MNASRPRTRRPVEPPPSGKIPAAKPTLRESIAFTVDGPMCNLTIPADVVSTRVGRSLLLRLAAHAEILCGDREWTVEVFHRDIAFQVNEKGQRGWVYIKPWTSTEEAISLQPEIQKLLHQAAAALLREVVS